LELWRCYAIYVYFECRITEKEMQIGCTAWGQLLVEEDVTCYS